MFPVVHALQRSTWFAPVVVTTGQHRDLVQPILDLAGIDARLRSGRRAAGAHAQRPRLDGDRLGSTRSAASGSMQQAPRSRRANRSGRTASPSRRSSTATPRPPHAAAVAAFNLRIPVGHVEAGLRTWTTLTPFPEELNRQLIPRVAAFHLAPTSISRQNLVREGDPRRADLRHRQHLHRRAAVRRGARRPRMRTMRSRPWSARVEPYVVVTAHRRENWNGGLARIAEAIGRLATSHPAWRLHPAASSEPARAARARRAARRAGRTSS